METLLDDLDAFLQEHRRCGELDTGVEPTAVWITCSCGAALDRQLPRKDGDATDVAPPTPW
jgi:hypothetical protein